VPPPVDDLTLVPGTPLAHYVVRRPIGTGAMGTVYEAHDTALDRTVALKVVNPHLAGDPDIAERFAREARAAARANHANLTHVYFVGKADGRPFYAMEYVPGVNLEERIAKGGPLPLADAIDILVQAAKGLEAAHATGVVHRDVKPSNLMVLPDGRVKVTDFGLSKSLLADPGATQAGQVMGTPFYMSPEQCRGEATDPRTDVYALGLTGWFLLTGRPAFANPSVGAVLNDQINKPLPSLAAARADLPPAADDVLRTLCAKDPAARPKSMREVVRLLESVRPRVVRPAPFATRGAAFAIDAFLLSIVGSALSSATTHLGGWLGLEEGFWGRLGFAIALATIAFGSQWGMERWYDGSVGKQLLGIAVVDENGARPSNARLLARFFVRFPGFVAMLIPESGGLLGKIDFVLNILQLVAIAAGMICWPLAKRRTISDLLTRTRVAYQEPVATTAEAA
jgi:uncharacterized RDD family membrane protein YckC/predicted Ser/Thr protein kinase